MDEKNGSKGGSMKLFIVDDSAVVRERLIAMLSEIRGVEITGQAEEPQEAIEAIRKSKPDTVILDIRVPGGKGIDILQKMKKERPTTKVIMFTNYPYPQYRKKCMDAGADYFFDKSTEFEKVSEVIKQKTKNF
jgi:DNA-binding NarL/FixJ family response regulator